MTGPTGCASYFIGRRVIKPVVGGAPAATTANDDDNHDPSDTMATIQKIVFEPSPPGPAPRRPWSGCARSLGRCVSTALGGEVGCRHTQLGQLFEHSRKSCSGSVPIASVL